MQPRDGRPTGMLGKNRGRGKEGEERRGGGSKRDSIAGPEEREERRGLGRGEDGVMSQEWSTLDRRGRRRRRRSKGGDVCACVWGGSL